MLFVVVGPVVRRSRKDRVSLCPFPLTSLSTELSDVVCSCGSGGSEVTPGPSVLVSLASNLTIH